MAIDKDHASEVVKRLFESELQCCKFTLISGADHQRIPIHRHILITASKYFEALLGPSFYEGDHDEFTLYGVDGATLKMIVDFCYTGHINLTGANVGKIAAIASSVQLDLLEAKCQQFYNNQLTVSNCVETLSSSIVLHQRALDVICESFNILDTKHIQILAPQSLEDVLKCDLIEAPEELIFTRLMQWYQKAKAERKAHMPQLLKFIRLELISTKFLNDTLDAIYGRFKCSELVKAEREKRASDQRSNAATARSRSIFFAFARKEEDTGRLIVNVFKYIRTLNIFEKVRDFIEEDNFKIFNMNFKLSVALTPGHEINTMPWIYLGSRVSTRIFFENHMYAFGGVYDNSASRSCGRFNMETKTWEEIKSMNAVRWFPSAAVLNGHIYVASESGQMGNSVEMYDPKSDEWTEVAAMHKHRLIFTLIESNGYLFAMGGDPIVERYDPRENCWTMLGSFEGSHSIKTGADVDGEITVMLSDGSFGRIEIDENDDCSFHEITKTDFTDAGLQNFSLFRN